jgi:multicomponent K+:H+ antiporter subunit A
MRRLNGLFKYMPHTAVLAMVAASSMAGVPLLNGFLSKEMFFGETLQLGGIGLLTWAVPFAATLGGVFSVAYSARFIHDVFFNGEPIDLPKTPHEPPRWMKIPVEVLVVLCLLVGVFPQLVIGPLLHVAAVAVAGGDVLPDYSLAIWHGFNVPLLMSCVALVVGLAVYASRHQIYLLHDRIFPPVSGKELTEDYLGWLLAFSKRVTAALENGSLQRYIALAIGSALVVGVAPFVGGLVAREAEPLTGVDPATVVSALITAGAGFAAAVCHRQRFLALIPVGIVGLFTALAFARLAAPDLALTQLVVEVATVILLLLVLFYLPQRSPRESSKTRLFRDAVLAGMAGIGMALVTWTILTRPFESISDYFLENAVPLGGGSNVVNVILADFRGFDTLGEAVVLVVAGIGIYAMLHGLRLSVPGRDMDGRPWARDVHPLVLAQISRPLLALAIVVAAYLFLRGHGLPGGGFVAGLVVGTAAILQYMANGIMWARERLLPDYRPLLALGVLIAGGTGAASWVFETPFLNQTFHHAHLPIVGEFELTSAMIFESGVFLAVVGTVMLILAELGHLSLAGKLTPPTSPEGD